MLVSATCSLPPFAATSVAAGAADIRLVSFVTAGLVGRFIRFGALAAFPAAVQFWLF
jgi:membrane protein YqaA with SNARE-associated domain